MSPFRGLERWFEDRWQGAVFFVARTTLRLVTGKRRLAFRKDLRSLVPLDYASHPVKMDIGSPQEWVRTRECEKEPETVAWLEAELRSGDTFYDVGANTGAYSLVAAALLGEEGRVFSFEPGAATYACLVRNVQCNGMSQVVPMPVALCDRTGLVTMHARSEAEGFVSSFEADDACQAVQPSLCYRLDDLIAQLGLPAPSLLKMDTDQTEDLILAGAPQTLANPMLRSILVEVDTGSERCAGIHAVLCDAGFELASNHPHGTKGVANRIYRRSSRDESRTTEVS
ncbi:MAG: hypothetical protein AMXMBFR81_31430 [Chthonomonas sp.]|nr:FkbM family methyltransferase [Fimbriimonadaceae bacterium]